MLSVKNEERNGESVKRGGREGYIGMHVLEIKKPLLLGSGSPIFLTRSNYFVLAGAGAGVVAGLLCGADCGNVGNADGS